MAFHVGQKVVCVDADFHSDGLYPPKNLPVEGSVYTIRGVVSNERWSWYYLVEIVNAPSEVGLLNFGKIEPAFKPSHFRPVAETKTSTSFTEGDPKDSETWDNRRKVEVPV